MRLLTTMIAALALAAPVRAQEGDIPAVIGDQISAFRADDFATAFGFASPGIRQLFRNPENFGRMVREGYPMVWRPERVTFLELRQDGGRAIQRIMVRDARGAVHVLDYDMIRTADGWRIDAVRVVRDGVPGV